VSTDPELLDSGHPSSLHGIEFIEYSTARPLALGHVLELMGFQPVPLPTEVPRATAHTAQAWSVPRSIERMP
jgi:4-hydroxyphenylpyruvate dioxygenase-like putative hemolysin